MEIKYKGVGCIELNTKKTSFLIDPYGDEYGIGKLKSDASNILYTNKNRSSYDPGKNTFVIEGPGEYEIKEVSIKGIPAKSYTGEGTSTIFTLRHSDINVAVIGDIAQDLNDEQIEAIGVVHIVVIPVGGGGVLDHKQAAKLVRVLEPKMVIPTYYDDGKTKFKEHQEKLELFVNELGVNVHDTDKLKLKSSSIGENLQVVLLKRA